MRSARLNEIVAVIKACEIHSQDELLSKLKEKGFHLTQATLSRDLKHLQIAKVPNQSGQYIYMIPTQQSQRKPNVKARSIHGFISLAFSGNLGFIKTLPGYANSVASVIDDMQFEEILGTVAGNDSILILPREYITAEQLREVLALKFPEIHEQL